MRSGNANFSQKLKLHQQELKREANELAGDTDVDIDIESSLQMRNVFASNTLLIRSTYHYLAVA